VETKIRQFWCQRQRQLMNSEGRTRIPEKTQCSLTDLGKVLIILYYFLHWCKNNKGKEKGNGSL